jgi:formylglycine-generating enzyme required for sulfatase activity
MSNSCQIGSALALLLLSGVAVANNATQQAPNTFKDCDDCPEMVIVPAGRVMLGAGSDAFDRKPTERVRREAVIAMPYALAQHEVTRAQFAAFVAATRYVPSRGVVDGKLTPAGCNYWNGRYGFVPAHDWRNPGFVQRDDEPVVCVSFADAEAFAAWLTRRTGRAYRVPSSVEFEYAARAGSDAAWYWGNQSEEACLHANIADQTLAQRWPSRQSYHCDDGFEHTAPSKRFQPNAFGLYDMIGNAWEWTADCWRDDLADAPTDGSAQRAPGGDCAFRTPMGGSWISGPGWSRASVRSKDPEHYRSFMLGFRVAAETEKLSRR